VSNPLLSSDLRVRERKSARLQKTKMMKGEKRWMKKVKNTSRFRGIRRQPTDGRGDSIPAGLLSSKY
jgi:hypothetical protein